MHSFSSRAYQSEDDFRLMQALLIEGRARTDDWYYPHVGELQWNFFMVACHLNPTACIRLWYQGSTLAGYAMIGEDPSLDFQVLPDYEWRGIEREAIAWAEEQIAEFRQRDPQRWSGHCVSTARQDNAARRAFLEKHGFQIGGPYPEVHMLCLLDQPIPEVELPAGCQVRSIRDDGDIPNRAGAQREVWHPWSVGDVSDADYAAFMRLPGYHPDLDVVAVAADGVMAAYVNGWIDPLNKIGDFGPVGARKAYRRQGLTRAALLESLRRMQACGMNRVCLSTGVTNEPAIRLYESVGFRILNKTLEYQQTG